MKLKEYFPLFLQYKRAKHESISTRRQYERYIKCLAPIGEKELCDLKKNDDVLVRIEGRKHGEFGEQRAISVYRVFLSWLEDEGLQIPFKWEKIESVILPRKDQYYLTPEEFEDFVSKIDTSTFYGLRDRLFYETLWSCALRVGEALAIDEKDITLDPSPEKREIHIHTEKGGEGDKVPISDRLMYWITTYLERKVECGPLFINVVNGDPKRMGQISVFKNLKKYKEMFGITKPMNHMCFRRGSGSHAMDSGYTFIEVKTHLRHKSPNTTVRAYLYHEKLKTKAKHNKVFSGAAKTEMVEEVSEIIKGRGR
jgi:site-specific recombinase XerD